MYIQITDKWYKKGTDVYTIYWRHKYIIILILKQKILTTKHPLSLLSSNTLYHQKFDNSKKETQFNHQNL